MTADTPRGAVDLTSLKGKTPDSVRIHPYDRTVHVTSQYHLEPETRPPDYQPGKDGYFNVAKRKVQMLILGLVVGGVVIGIIVAIIVSTTPGILTQSRRETTQEQY